jgi:hypothetical protein
MAKRNAFIKEFKKLLKSIPDNYTLPQWQFAYRQVLYSMGMKILENFEDDVVGPDPSGAQGAGPKPGQSPSKSRGPEAGGQTGGGHQTVCKFVCAVLDVTPIGGNPPPVP